MSSPEEGGTRIQRRPPPPPQQQMPPPPPPQQQMDPRLAGGPPPQQYQQEQVYQQQMPPVPPIKFKKSNFGASSDYVDFSSVTFKYAVIVACIFVLLNSKIIWKQIIQFPFMGGAEPSILALFVNSILAGIIFYILSKQF